MRAMILAAGYGKRMGALTVHKPKPLLRIADHYLIEHVIMALVKAHIKEIVINIFYHGDQIRAALGDGRRYNAHIVYSAEQELLETGGGIIQALPLLGREPFVVMSSDIVTHYPLQQLPSSPVGMAHLVLVDNPAFHPCGDFGLLNNMVMRHAENRLTFANIGVYRPELFVDWQAQPVRLAEILYPAIQNRQVTGEYYAGVWYNIGEPHTYDLVNQWMTATPL